MDMHWRHWCLVLVVDTLTKAHDVGACGRSLVRVFDTRRGDGERRCLTSQHGDAL